MPIAIAEIAAKFANRRSDIDDSDDISDKMYGENEESDEFCEISPSNGIRKLRRLHIE